MAPQQDTTEAFLGVQHSGELEDSLQQDGCYIMAPDDASLPPKIIDTDLQALASRTFFNSKDSLLAEAPPRRNMGQAGDPVPYTVRADNSLTLLLLLCFVIFVVSLAHTKHFIAKQVKDFFWQTPASHNSSESGGELRFMLFLSLVNALVLAISSYLLADEIVGTNVMGRFGLLFIAVLFAAFTVHYLLKWLLETVVNLTFFGVKKNLQWMTVQLQVTALQGVLLFPVLALQIYFDFSTENALIYIALVLFLNKILTLFKSFQIFFSGNGLYLQTFLYFCSLEIAPMLALAGIGLTIIDTIKINF